MAKAAEMADLTQMLQRHREELAQQLERWYAELDGLILSAELAPSQPAHTTQQVQVVDLVEFGEDMNASKRSDDASPDASRGSSASFARAALKRQNSQTSIQAARAKGSREDFLRAASVSKHIDYDSQHLYSLRTRCQTAARKIVDSSVFNVFFALVIVSNSVYLGAQLEMSTSSTPDSVELTIHTVYAVLFSIEVCIRLSAAGLYSYCWGLGCSWNWLDVVVVFTSWVSLIMDYMAYPGLDGAANTAIRMFRIFRATRLVRMIRALWIIRFVGALRTLVASLVDTLKSLFWALLLLFLIMYIVGLLYTDVVRDYLNEGGSSYRDELVVYFGSLYASITTLFRSILGGLDWTLTADALGPVGEFWVQFFNFYIAFCNFAVLNVMTGVFCNSAIKSAEKDHETIFENRQAFKELAKRLFKRLDNTNSGSLTFSQFERLFDDERMRAFLATADINAVDAWTLFASLDMDGDSMISVDEFTERCMQLHGPARSVDVYALTRQNLKLRHQLDGIEAMQQRMQDVLHHVSLGHRSEHWGV